MACNSNYPFIRKHHDHKQSIILAVEFTVTWLNNITAGNQSSLKRFKSLDIILMDTLAKVKDHNPS